MLNGNKIKELRESVGLSQEGLSLETGIPRGRISQWELRNATPKSEDLKKIATYFAKKGVWNEQNVADKTYYIPNAEPLRVSEDVDEYENRFGNVFTPLDNGMYIMQVPLVPEYSRAGSMAGFADKQYFEELPKHSIIVDKIHRGKYIAITNLGESMDYDGRDAIYDRAVVTGRELKQELWRNSKLHLNKYADFIIATKDGFITKRIIAHDIDRGIITCHSLNPNKQKYPDFDLNVDDIDNLFNIVKVENPR